MENIKNQVIKVLADGFKSKKNLIDQFSDQFSDEQQADFEAAHIPVDAFARRLKMMNVDNPSDAEQMEIKAIYREMQELLDKITDKFGLYEISVEEYLDIAGFVSY